MPDTQAATSRTRFAYDHRIRNQVVKTGTRCLPKHIRITRSTVSTWRRRGSRPVVTIEQPDQDRQQLLDTITRLERQKHVLAAVVRVLLSLLRAFGISLAGERLPEGDAKAGILRAITSAKAFLPLAVILRIVRLEPRRYHAWNRRASGLACGLDDRSSCPRTSPSQLTPTEMADIKDMVLAPENRHMALGTLATQPNPPSARAMAPNEIWHVDVTVLKLLDGTKAYIHAVIDNYSRKILAWMVAPRLEPTGMC